MGGQGVDGVGVANLLCDNLPTSEVAHCASRSSPRASFEFSLFPKWLLHLINRNDVIIIIRTLWRGGHAQTRHKNTTLNALCYILYTLVMLGVVGVMDGGGANNNDDHHLSCSIYVPRLVERAHPSSASENAT